MGEHQKRQLKKHFSYSHGQFETKKKNMHSKSVFSEVFYVICQWKDVEFKGKIGCYMMGSK